MVFHRLVIEIKASLAESSPIGASFVNRVGPSLLGTDTVFLLTYAHIRAKMRLASFSSMKMNWFTLGS